MPMHEERLTLSAHKVLFSISSWLLVSQVFVAGPALAQQFPSETREEAQQMADSLFQGSFPIDDAAPEIAVPTVAQRNASPLDFASYLMELGERADRATQRGDHLTAAKYLRAVTLAVPERSIGFSELCRAYEEAGDKAQALSACAAALQKSGV